MSNIFQLCPPRKIEPKLSEVEDALQEAKNTDFDDIIVIGFKDGHPTVSYSSMNSVDPFKVVGVLDVMKDVIKLEARLLDG